MASTFQNMRFLAAAEQFEREPNDHHFASLDSEINRNWKNLNLNEVKGRKGNLQTLWTNGSRSPPRRDFDERKTLFDGLNYKCEAFLRASGPPKISDQTIVDGLPKYSFIDASRLDSNKPPVIVAHLPKRPASASNPPRLLSVPPQTPVPSFILKEEAEGYRATREEKTSPVFFSNRKVVRFSSHVQAFDPPSESRNSDVENFHFKSDHDDHPKRRKILSQIINDADERGELRLRQEHLRCKVPSRQDMENSVEFLKEGEKPEIYRCRAGVKLTRPGYYCIPSLRELDDLINPQTGDCFVEDFEVGHREFGSIVFDGFTNVAGIDLDKIILFSDMSIDVYKSQPVPKFLNELHRPATVTLKNVWPWPKEKSALIDEEEKNVWMENFDHVLRDICNKSQSTFIRYEPRTGSWIFRIQEKPPSPTA